MSQITYFLFTARPFEFAVLKPFVQQKKSIILPQQNFQSVSASSAEQKCTIIGIVKKCAVREYPKSVIDRYQAAW
jgi:hypothetical protein